MKRALRWVAGGVLALALLIVAVGVGWEQWVRRKLSREMPAPGRVVDVQGRAEHLRCAGEGSPVVVLEAGGPPLEAPDGVPPEVVERTQKEIWPALQREVAALSARGEFRRVEGAGHYVHHYRPEVVVEAVRDGVSAVRGEVLQPG